MDIYTIMLAISLFAIIVAIAALWMEMARFGYDFKAAGAKSVLAPAPVQSPLPTTALV